MQNLRENFLNDGYVVVSDLLSPKAVDRIRSKIDHTLLNLDLRHRESFPKQGSMVPLPAGGSPWSEVIANQEVRDVIRSLGGEDVRWLSGYLISKPPRSPRLWWHQDWWAWQHAISDADVPPQLSAMIYPAGASVVNGCLRVIPGSHRRRHALHDKLPEAHSRTANLLTPDHVAFSDQLDEVSVPVNPHDVIFCDVRLLHSTHANKSTSERPCLTLWYLPDFGGLPGDIRAHYQQHPCQPSEMERRSMPSEVVAMLLPPVRKQLPLSSMQLVRSPV